MNAYVDSSVLLRRVFAEPEQLRSWSQITRSISSELIKVECMRAVDRARLLMLLEDDVVADRRAAILALIASFDLVPISPPILDLAANPFPTTIGSLDAIHLATAIEVRDQVGPLLLATHDRELATAARAVGFDVDGT